MYCWRGFIWIFTAEDFIHRLKTKGKSEEQLPQKTVGWLLANCWPTVRKYDPIQRHISFNFYKEVPPGNFSPFFLYECRTVLKKKKNTPDKQDINLWFIVYLHDALQSKNDVGKIINKLGEAFCKASCCTNEQVFFILGEDDGLLVLVDQHAAHERVRLEHLQSGRSKNLLCFNCFFAFSYCLVLIDWGRKIKLYFDHPRRPKGRWWGQEKV